MATEHNSTEHNRTLSAAAKAAADVEGFFSGVDLVVAEKQAGMVWKSIFKPIPKDTDSDAERATKLAALDHLHDYIWQVCTVAQIIKPDLISTIIPKLESKQIKNFRTYVSAALRGECEKRGVELDELCQRCPPKAIEKPKPPPNDQSIPQAVLQRVPRPERGIRELGHNKSHDQVTVGS